MNIYQSVLTYLEIAKREERITEKYKSKYYSGERYEKYKQLQKLLEDLDYK
jgi:hypothetical protein